MFASPIFLLYICDLKYKEMTTGEDYRFVYHRNTYAKNWAAMTVESVPSYFNGDDGDYARGKTRVEAIRLLKEKLDGRKN